MSAAPAPMPEPTPAPAAPQGGMPEDPMMGGDPMGGDMPEDPMAGGEEMPQDPNMETPMGDESEGGDDKKKEIQKLAGELSELLHTYNEENGDDEELNKYVKGMIDAQTDGDSDDEDDEDTNMEGDEEMGNPEEMGENPMGDEEIPEEPQDTEQPKMEGRRLTKKQLKEEFAQNCKKEKEKIERTNKKLNKSGVTKNNPFTPPKFN